MVSLVPDLPGDLVVDVAALNAFRTEVVNKDPLVVRAGVYWTRVTVGRRRLVADSTLKDVAEACWLATELHGDGSGSFAVVVPDLNAVNTGT